MPGPTPPSGPVREADRYLADAMLGRLARWLRALGYDTAYSQGEDGDLLRQARDEGRLLLTRDRLLARRAREQGLLVPQAPPLEQLRFVLTARPPAHPPRPFSRCLLCNLPLEELDPGLVRLRVPEVVARTHSRFLRCPGCLRIYWAGSHWARMRQALARTLADLGWSVDL